MFWILKQCYGDTMFKHSAYVHTHSSFKHTGIEDIIRVELKCLIEKIY